MKFTPRFAMAAGALAVGLATVGTAVAVQASPPSPNSTAAVQALAANTATTFVSTRPAVVHPSADDAFIQHPVISSGGMQYVPYDRSYKGLQVVGGDFVVVINAAGQITNTSVAQQQAIGNLSVTPALAKADAEAVARKQVTNPTTVEGTTLVVYALDTPRLAWESIVDGTGAEGPSRLSVDVDAITGTVLHTQEHVLHGTGTAAWNGPNPVTINTTHSGTTYSMADPTIRNLSCQDFTTHATLTGTDDAWGNGNATSKETGCVDALFTAQTEYKMLSSWLGRNGMDGSGGAWPIRIGLNDENAYYDGTQVAVGHNTANQWIGELDVVGHEMGHGVDDHTPGGISGSGTQEFVADTFGAETEWYANEPSAYDGPDFQVGEKVNLVGSGPIRYMYNPSLAGDSNCYSSSTPSQEVHAAAGPGNHWFYLVAEGTSPTNGQPTSPTCNSTSVTGLGIQTAAKIMYNAMLMKTTGSSYLRYRVWTLQAAKNLTPGNCAAFNTVKAAWNAVSVPAQSGEATCTDGGPTTEPTSASPTPTGGGSCSGQRLTNPGFESGSTGWTASTGVIGQNSSQGEPARTGTWNAYLDGYGTTHTDTLTQSFSIPAGCHATLSFWTHIDTAETTTTTAYDKLTVQAGSSTLVTLSNLNKVSGYTQRSYDISSLAGTTVTLRFTGTEDSGLQTSFVIDDTAVNLS
ncbi:zinc metalloprotease [Rugosimonospora africana]|uniref:Zinc metalloprotease n=2 Tax=Rugosimonospora africana TaxID=556532 RepID=A0A8J3QP49_9ACTN|nr:M4 family metallopeptidase [Rugosimonospora africana]GIH14493.1 zinc metalloprotease [Rugosimonospora africana]